MTLQTSFRPALALALVSALLAGCAEMHHGVEAVARLGPSVARSEEADAAPVARPDVKTVRPRGAPRAPASDTSAAEPAEAPYVVAAAVPTPRQIFDFHPAGSAPGTFRQPFIIDPNDGPLAADVRRSAKELRDFLAAQETAPKSVASKRCSETDVATAKPGCMTPATKAATASARNASVVQ